MTTALPMTAANPLTDLAPYLDHSVLRPDAVARDIDQGCDDALIFRFRGLCIPSGAAAHAKRRLLDTGVKVVSVVGFPHGTAAPDVKAHEAMRAAAMGADEIDYVISIGAAIQGDVRFLQEEAVAILRQTRGKLVKAIVEVGCLDPAQAIRSARALADAGVHYVKTCTGFGPRNCTADDVRLLVGAVAGKALVKAAGGIRERWQAVEMIQAGAAVVGTSQGPAMCAR
jgi:deoxyribose-phosphate aldolase